jgi:hypothetical protein
MRPVLLEAMQGDLLRSIEAVFEEFDTGSDVIEIPTLELQVRIADSGELVTRLPELVAAQVRERLGSLASGAQPTRRQPVAEYERQALATYLRTGRVPAAVQTTNTSELVELLQSAALRWWRDELAAWAGTSGSGPFLLRLLQLLPESEWGGVARAACQANPVMPVSQAAGLVERLTRISAAVGIAHHRLEAVSAVIQLARGDDPSHSHARIQEIVTALGSSEVNPSGRFSTEGLRVLRKLVDLVEGNPLPPHPAVRSHHLARPAPPAAGPETASTTLLDGPLPALVPSAGLVLIHPFLPELFRRTGITWSDGLVAPQLPTAAALLQWLATGGDNPAEFELSFIKVLLGLDPETPLVAGGGLVPEPCCAAGNDLLASVIAHWSALRSTSIAGLRASFLRRAGLLRRVEDGWRLQVMREGFDVLLNHLPWGIGVIRLPWMPHPLFVEWPTL